jgi:LemA protein
MAMKNPQRILVLILVALGLGVSSCSTYNSMIEQREEVTKSWSEIENQLQRRNDLIPNYVETVKGYATHEQEVFTKVAESRAKLAGAQTVEDKMNASNQLSGALARLLVIAEQYPELKANQNFTALQDELAGTENRIAVARGRYNEAAKNYNAYIQKFPQLVLARAFKFDAKPYFEAPAEAQKAPQVKF